jgi:glycosyltransferase involved in cell wall biosynthesis
MYERIYVIANTYIFPSSAGTSGGNKHLIELLKRLEVYGFSFTIISPKIGRAYLESFGVQGNFAITSSIDNRYGVAFPFIWNMLKSIGLALKLPKECIIYSEADALPNIFPAFIAKIKNKGMRWAVAFHLVASNPLQNLEDEIRHGHLLRGFLFFVSQRMSLLLIKPLVDLVFTGDNGTKNFLLKMGVPADKVKIIKMGVDAEKISNIKVSKKIYDACFIGRFHLQKGIYDLIEIWNRVCRVKERSKLGIIGGGNKFLEKKIRYAIQNRSKLCNNVDFLGFRFGIEYYKIIKSSRILIFPSKHEGNPIVPLDAMACGVPVIAYRLPVLEEMYKKGIIMVPMGNIELFARNVLNLLDDEAQTERIGLEAFESASQFDWNITIREVIEHLKHLAGTQSQALITDGSKKVRFGEQHHVVRLQRQS